MENGDAVVQEVEANGTAEVPVCQCQERDQLGNVICSCDVDEEFNALVAEIDHLKADNAFYNFVKETVDEEDLADASINDEEFVPKEEDVDEAEDGGSSEDDLDEVESKSPAKINGNNDLEVSEVPKEMWAEAAVRFPPNWRTNAMIRSKKCDENYNSDEDLSYDPDEVVEEGMESTSSISESESDDATVDEAEVDQLADKIEDMVIPSDEQNLIPTVDTPQDTSIAEAIVSYDLTGYTSDTDPDFVVTNEDLEKAEDASDDSESDDDEDGQDDYGNVDMEE